VASVASSTTPAAVAPGRRAARAVHLVGAGLSLALLALNGTLLWGRRPPPDLKAIAKLTDPSAVEAALKLRLARSPYDVETRRHLAMHYGQTNRPRESAEALALVPFFWPSKADALNFEGRQWLLAGYAAKAEQAFRAYLADDPNHPVDKPQRDKAEVALINVLSMEDRWDEVRELVWRIYDRVPPKDHREPTIMALRTRLERSSPAAALPTLRRYAEADPEDWQARRALARASQATGDPATADREGLAAIAAKPLDVAARRDRLAVLEARNDPKALLAAAAELPPESANDGATWAHRAWAHTQVGDLKAAVAAYREAARSLPFEPEIAYQLSLVERRRGDANAAEAARRRSTLLRDARAPIPKLLTEFVDAADSPDPKQVAARDAAAWGLAERCRTLGWARDAEAWARLPGEL